MPAPNRRLVKRAAFSNDDEVDDENDVGVDTPQSPVRPEPTSSVRPLNAFDILKQGAVAHAQGKELGKRKRKLDRSDFVVGEAEESDEDALFGFTSKQHESDEDSDDAQDQPLADLVDDTVMDAETEAVDKVLEKVK